MQVTASYPGANAEVVADSVAAVIEQQVNGVEKMMYMSSQCTNDGSYTLTVTFELGTDLNMAQVLVQNRVSLAMAQLPEQVQLQGVNTNKQSPSILLAVNLYSPDGRFDDLYLSNYATIQIKDELLRIDGVGNINYLGERDYSHAGLARSRQNGRPQHHDRRRDQRGEKSKRAGGRRHHRPAAGSQGTAVSVDDEHAGAADGPEANSKTSLSKPARGTIRKGSRRRRSCG